MRRHKVILGRAKKCELIFFLALLAVIGSSFFSDATAANDSVQIVIESKKSEYKLGEDIEITISLVNNGSNSVNVFPDSKGIIDANVKKLNKGNWINVEKLEMNSSECLHLDESGQNYADIHLLNPGEEISFPLENITSSPSTIASYLFMTGELKVEPGRTLDISKYGTAAILQIPRIKKDSCLTSYILSKSFRYRIQLIYQYKKQSSGKPEVFSKRIRSNFTEFFSVKNLFTQILLLPMTSCKMLQGEFHYDKTFTIDGYNREVDIPGVGKVPYIFVFDFPREAQAGVWGIVNAFGGSVKAQVEISVEFLD